MSQDLVSINDIQIEITNTTNETEGHSYIDILDQAVNKLGEFNNILNYICNERHNIPIKHILKVFSNIQQAENDLRAIESIFDSTKISRIRSVISFWTYHDRIYHICMGCLTLSQLTSAIIDSPLLCSIVEINEETSNLTCASLYEEYQNQFDIQYSIDILTLISFYSSSSDLLDFIQSLTINDVENMLEAASDWDITLCNTKTILDFQLVKDFLGRVYAEIEIERRNLEGAPFPFEHIVACFESVWKNDRFINLLKCFKVSSFQLKNIQCLYADLFNKESSTQSQITDILLSSTINFFQIKHRDMWFDVRIQDIFFGDLNALRDRVLFKYSGDQSQFTSENIREKLRHFIRFTEIIKFTLETLKTLHMAGHPSIATFISPQIVFTCVDRNYDDLRQHSTKLAILLDEREKNLCEMYARHINLTYFWNDQLWLIEKYIYDPLASSHPGYHLLKFIGIETHSPLVTPEREETPEARLKNLGCLLIEQRQPCFYPQVNFLKKNVFLIETMDEDILRAILSLFSLTNTCPTANQIFYCTSRTNWIQVRGFVYRCFYSQMFHQMIRPEFLSQSIQNQFIQLLHSLIKQQPRQTFQFGIITINKRLSQQLINGFQTMGILTELNEQSLLDRTNLKKNIEHMIRNCTLVTSRIAGLGKSSFIRQEISRLQKRYAKFPISGNFDVDTLTERLCSVYTQLQDGAIHLDIGNTNNIQQLHEILYCLLLFRSIRFGEIAASIPAETPVYIELDSLSQSIKKEVTLFQYLPILHLDSVDWKTLNVENIEIQTAGNYLLAIEDQRIIKQDADISRFTKLDLETCCRVIKRSFLQTKDVSFITWTQLFIFISISNHLFEGFSRCSFSLLDSCNPCRHFRTDLIQILFRSINQLTSISTKTIHQEEHLISNDEATVLGDDIVRWDKTPPFALIFTVTQEPFFIYKSPMDVPRA